VKGEESRRGKGTGEIRQKGGRELEDKG